MGMGRGFVSCSCERVCAPWGSERMLAGWCFPSNPVLPCRAYAGFSVMNSGDYMSALTIHLVCPRYA